MSGTFACLSKPFACREITFVDTDDDKLRKTSKLDEENIERVQGSWSEDPGSGFEESKRQNVERRLVGEEGIRLDTMNGDETSGSS